MIIISYTSYSHHKLNLNRRLELITTHILIAYHSKNKLRDRIGIREKMTYTGIGVVSEH